MRILALDLGKRKSVACVYDGLNRLVSEQLDASDDSLDYTTTYSFDLASNHTQMSKDVGSNDSVDKTIDYVYDANDRLLIEKLDSNGDTVIDETTVYVYGPNADFSDPQNPFGGDHTTQTQKTTRNGDTLTGSTYTSRMKYEYDAMGQQIKVEIDADGDETFETVKTYEYNHNGLRISETADGETTEYVFDTRNPTGHAKQIEEYIDGALSKTYVLGHQVIAQHDGTNGLLILLHDGHGSTRALIDDLATIVEQYAYNAYGETLNGQALTMAAVALTTWLRPDGMHDPVTGLDFHILRWREGPRFLKMDSWAGNTSDPQTLHKYLYAHANPVMGMDPSGRAFVDRFEGSRVHRFLGQRFRQVNRLNRYRDRALSTLLRVSGGVNPGYVGIGRLRVDLAEINRPSGIGSIYEIKHADTRFAGATIPAAIGLAQGQLQLYQTFLDGMAYLSGQGVSWSRGNVFASGIKEWKGYNSRLHPGSVLITLSVYPVNPGVILYDLVDGQQAKQLVQYGLAGGAAFAFYQAFRSAQVASIAGKATQGAIAAGRIDMARFRTHLSISKMLATIGVV